MSNGHSRNKGYRGEREVVKLLGSKAERTGYAGTDNPDVTTDFAIYSVKNQRVPISLNKAVELLRVLESKAPDKHHFVAVKVKHAYLIIERGTQHRDDHC